jgi:iron complex transport system substrate-binding protein
MTRSCLLLALSLSLAACADKAATPANAAPVAAAPAVVASPAEPRSPQGAGPRLVTIGSAVTEIVFALGRGEQIVAADKSSLYPEAAAKIATLPYFRQVSAEGVLALAPTLVLVGQDAGPESALQQIEAAGVRVVRVPEVKDIATAKARVVAIAAALDPALAAEAEALNKRLDAQLEQAKTRRDACANREAPPRALFVYARGPGMLMVGGKETPADVMFGLADAQNAAGALEGFKPLTAEAVVAADPEVIVFTTKGLDGLGGADGALKIPGVAQTAAGKNKRFVALDDLKLLGMGPRAGEAALELVEALHDCP